MEDLKAVARMARWGLKDTLHQLDFIPEDRLDWKPVEGGKSALDMVAEVAMVVRYAQPVFRGEDMQPVPLEKPANREEAKALLRAALEPYIQGLENAGPEVERPVQTPVGAMAGSKSLLYGVIELLHHHGQLTMLQSLLGDQEVHISEEGMQEFALEPGG